MITNRENPYGNEKRLPLKTGDYGTSPIYTLFQWENHTTVNPGVPYTPDHEVYPYQTDRHLIEIICEDQQVWMTVEPALAAL